MKKVFIIIGAAVGIIAVAVAAVLILARLDDPVAAESGVSLSAGADYADGAETVLTIDGETMDWDEYYMWLKYSALTYQKNYGEITDWTGGSEENEDVPNYEAVKNYALYVIKLYKALENRADEEGIALTKEDESRLAADWENAVAGYGGEEKYLAAVTESYGSREMYDYFCRSSLLYTKCFEKAYGEGGSVLSDEDVAEYIQDDGYMMVKSVLIKTVDENGEALTEDQLAAAKKTAEEAAAKLAAYEGDGIEAFFDGLMAEYSQDATGSDGYLFLPGELDSAFESAVSELSEYEYSGVVQLENGYCVILRLPVDYDAVPFEYASCGENSSLRYVAADGMFYSAMETWGDRLQVEESDFYRELNIARVFVS